MTPARHVGTALYLCNTESIGYVALKAISVSPTASVVGTTSRGIFLRTPSKQILFISFEPYRGPLTINTARKITNVGLSVQITDSHLFIGDAAICISTADLWQPDPLPSTIAPLPTRIATLQHFLNRAAIRPNLVIPSEARNLFDNLAESLILNLGRGQGLTPSGDDVAIGFLLTLNRYANVVETLHATSLKTINKKMIAEARARTTTLSVNLIECAALGLADERLIRVVDCIFTGERDDRALDEMLGWGESSGLNALIGMNIAVCG